MCGVPFHAADGYITRLVKQGLPRRHLRADRGSEAGQGRRQARGRARRLAGHPDRRQLPRRARAGVPAGARARRRPRRRASRRGAARSLDRRVRRRRVRRRRRTRRRCADEIARAAPARDGRGRASTRRRCCPEIAQPGVAVTAIDGWAFDARPRAPDAARSAAGQQPRRLRARGPPRRHRAPPARSSHYLRDTQKADLAHVRAVRLRQRADGLLIDPMTLKHLEIVEGAGRRPRRVAARRARSHGHRRWAAGCCAPGCCGR